MKLSELLQGLDGGEFENDPVIRGLSCDSRQLRPGDLFVALSGEREHGLCYLDRAEAAGAVAVLVEPPCEHLPKSPLPIRLISGLRDHLSTLADRFYNYPSRDVHLIGITGTDGKTSCSHFLGQVLDQCGIVGTVGYGRHGHLTPLSHTTPDILMLRRCLAILRDQGLTHVAMEVSSHALDQGRVENLIFDVGVLTNLGRDHLDYHGTVEAYANAKGRLFRHYDPRIRVLNMDDDFGRRLAMEKPGKVIGYGIDPFDHEGLFGWLQGTDVRLTMAGMSFRVDSSWGRGDVSVPLLGAYNVSNLLAVLGVMIARELPLDQALQRLSGVRGVPGRMEPFQKDASPLVVVDYAHTPQALETALKALRRHVRGKLVCVFGCGGDRDRGKRPLMGGAAENFADRVMVTDDNPRHENGQDIIDEIMTGIVDPARVMVERDRKKAIIAAIDSAECGDVVLIAGKGHEDYQIIGDQRMTLSDRQIVRERLVLC